MIYTLDCPDKKIKKRVTLPSSKSISNRLLIIHALSSGGAYPEKLSDSDDTQVLQNALKSSSEVIDIGHAGTSMRFLTAYFAATGQHKILTGSHRMKNRPIGDLVDALNQLGAGITYQEKEGYPPLRTSGKPLSGKTITINGNTSSQFISALLMIAPVLPEGLTVHITGNPVSSSYIQMTLELIKMAGVGSVWEGNTISIAPQKYVLKNETVEPDWSAASYWYQIAALAGDAEIFIERLSKDSFQGDHVASELFRLLGVDTAFTQEGALLVKSDKECAFFEFDFLNSPDLVQTMAVTLCLKNTPFRFTGANTLRVKETDRVAALQNELLKLGYCLEEPEAGIIEWSGKRVRPQKDILISTYQDHRMAMAFAPAAILFPGLKIENPEVVNKSYPAFWKDLEEAGFVIRKEE